MVTMRVNKVPAKANTTKSLAEASAKECEKRTEQYGRAKDNWVKKYPDAADDYRSLEEAKDELQGLYDKTKILIRDSYTQGTPCWTWEFKVQEKKTQPGYDSGEVLKVLVGLPQKTLAEALATLVEKGVIKDLVIDRDAAKVFFPHDQVMASIFEPAYREGGEVMTPAITVPKLR